MPRNICLILIAAFFSFFACFPCRSQSLDKLKRQAMNTSRITLSLGDSVQTFCLLAPEERLPQADLDRRYWWYGSGEVKSSQGGYSGRLLDGPYLLRTHEGDLLEEGQLTAGKRNGQWRGWYPGGALRGVRHYRAGQLHGPFEEYYPDGSLRREGRYRRGRLRGRVRVYESNGQRSLLRYREGEEVDPEREASGRKPVKESVKSVAKKLHSLLPFQKKKKQSPAPTGGSEPQVQQEEKPAGGPVVARKKKLRLPFRQNKKKADALQG
jgi:hypothetical protein